MFEGFTGTPYEPAAEVRQNTYVNVQALAAEVVVMEAANQGVNRRDGDARMERERAIGEKMMEHFLALAAQHGVEVPLEGCGEWLRSGLRKLHPQLAHDWRGYKLHTGFSNGVFRSYFRWAYDPEGAAAEVERRRRTILADPATGRKCAFTRRREKAVSKARLETLREIRTALYCSSVEEVIDAIDEELSNGNA
jgi:hypothetical protein